jgi:ATP-dependent DNA helicase RecG
MRRTVTEDRSISLADIPVTTLPGIGPHRADALKTVGVRTVHDLLYYFPRRYLDRSTIVPMEDLYRHVNSVVTVIGRVSGIMPIIRGKRRLVVTLRDARGSMDIVFFQGMQYWQKSLAVDEAVAVSGTVSVYGRRPNMVHPDIDRLTDEDSFDFINTGGIVPVYPSGADLEKVGLNRHGGFRKLLAVALQRHASQITDFFGDVDASGTAHPVRLRHNLAPLRDAIRDIHRPQSHEARERARRRLIFDEFFLLSLQLAYRKWKYASPEHGIAFAMESPTARALVNALPFSLTGAQRRAIREIADDMRSSKPMNRLLQGDVGSGKTVVALLTMLVAVDNGYQCALMVPTEILAEQHFRTITALLDDLRINVLLLTGQQPAAKRALGLTMIENGNVHIVVGTHALIQQEVRFHKLGLVIIDEQHRFGVEQRAELRGKGVVPDVLVMTATPIPRTLSMTLYGDLDVSTIDELPVGRLPVKTVIRFEQDRDGVWYFVAQELAKGNQAYIVFPLVSESEKIDLRAATEEYERLSADVFPNRRIGLVHGQMPAKEKDDVMMRFKRRELDVLVSTTVIEVGVDVPDATVMVIEHAERFGLAQLHQLRGRVGRSAKQSYCILMTEKAIFYAGAKTSEEKQERNDTRRRLETMRDSTDGFRIAEVDMEIRGPGDLWGTQQSGYPEFRIANLLEHADILRDARAEAFRIVEEDPQLRRPEHEGIRTVLGPVVRARLSIADIG